MGILRFLNEWKEKADGTLSGPALSTEDSLTESLAEKRLRLTSRDISSWVTDFDNDADVTLADNAAYVTDSSKYLTPAAAVEASPTDGFNDPTQINIDLASKGITDMTGRTVYVALKWPTEQNLRDSLHVRADLRAPDFSNRIEITRQYAKYEDEWLIYSFPLSARRRSDSGSPDITSVDELRLFVRAESGLSTTALVDSVWIEETTKSLVSICYDDGYDDVYEDFLPVHLANSIPASVAVVPDYVGNPDYLSEEQIGRLSRVGFEMISHTFASDDLADADAPKINETLKDAIQWLQRRGFDGGARSLVLPFGSADNQTFEISRQYHGLIRNTSEQINSYPVHDFGRVFGVNMDNYSVSEIQGFVDNVETHGGWLLLYAHDTADITTSDLDSVLSYTDSSNVDTPTLGDVLDMQQ